MYCVYWERERYGFCTEYLFGDSRFVRCLSLSLILLLCLFCFGGFVYASRSSLASKFIAAFWAFCVYYYCGSRIHSFLSFFHLFYLFHPFVVVLSLYFFLSCLHAFACLFSGVHIFFYLTLIHLRNVCFVFSHAINFNLAKNRKQR